MGRVNESNFRRNLVAYLDKVAGSSAPLFVTRGKGKGVVILAEDEYESMAETLHLLSNPANAEHLRLSIAELDAGGGEAHQLMDARSSPSPRC